MSGVAEEPVQLVAFSSHFVKIISAKLFPPLCYDRQLGLLQRFVVIVIFITTIRKNNFVKDMTSYFYETKKKNNAQMNMLHLGWPDLWRYIL